MDLRFFDWKNQANPGYYLSNFSNHAITVNGITYSTVEHYYQAAKFEDVEYQKNIAAQNTPYKAKILANMQLKYQYKWQLPLNKIINEHKMRGVKVRSDWSEIKDIIMYNGLVYKINQNPDVRSYLLQTKPKNLIESSPYDYYLGEGKDKNGLNKLGIMLMTIRNDL